MQADQHNQPNRTMKILGYAGLLPFIILLLVSIAGSGSVNDKAAESMLFYAAMILTFLGAVHWGCVLAVAGDNAADQKRLCWAVTPSLIAWVALMFTQQFTIVVLILSFVLCWWVDKRFYSQSKLAWYMTMRSHLTVVVVASLGILLLTSF